MADEAQDVDAGRIKDVGQAQRVAYAEKAARETEAAVKVEQEGKIQDPIPVVVDVLKKALGPKDNDTDFNHRVTSLHSYAREVKDRLNIEEAASDNPRDALAGELVEKGKLKGSVNFGNVAGGGWWIQDLRPTDVIPTLRTLGVIANAPDSLPNGEENATLIRFLRKGVVKESEVKIRLTDGSMVDGVALTKDTNIPGVDARLVFRKDMMEKTGFNSFGNPAVSQVDLVFSPQALASMGQ